MTTSPIGSGDAHGLNGVEPLHEWPAATSVWRAPSVSAERAEVFRGGSSGKLYRIGLQFMRDDLASLAAWIDDAGHGYDRVEVEQGLLEDGSWSSYALIYRVAQAWATWGIIPRGGQLEVWRCATGKTVGHHARMATALASLPHITVHRRELRTTKMADDGADRRCHIASSVVSV